MDIFDYIQSEMPNAIIKKMVDMGFPYDNNYTLDQNLRTFIKQCNTDQLDKFMKFIAENHPDKELILEYNAPNKIFKATGIDENQKLEPTKVEVAPSKESQEKLLSKMIQENLLKIAVVGVIIFLAIKNIK